MTLMDGLGFSHYTNMTVELLVSNDFGPRMRFRTTRVLCLASKVTKTHWKSRKTVHSEGQPLITDESKGDEATTQMTGNTAKSLKY